MNVNSCVQRRGAIIWYLYWQDDCPYQPASRLRYQPPLLRFSHPGRSKEQCTTHYSQKVMPAYMRCWPIIISLYLVAPFIISRYNGSERNSQYLPSKHNTSTFTFNRDPNFIYNSRTQRHMDVDVNNRVQDIDHIIQGAKEPRWARASSPTKGEVRASAICSFSENKWNRSIPMSEEICKASCSMIVVKTSMMLSTKRSKKLTNSTNHHTELRSKLLLCDWKLS